MKTGWIIVNVRTHHDVSSHLTPAIPGLTVRELNVSLIRSGRPIDRTEHIS